jgi:hypothetical protein
MNFDHLVCMDEDAGEIIIFRVDAYGKRTPYTKTAIPDPSAGKDVLGPFAKMLGENLLLDSPAAR